MDDNIINIYIGYDRRLVAFGINAKHYTTLIITNTFLPLNLDNIKMLYTREVNPMQSTESFSRLTLLIAI